MVIALKWLGRLGQEGIRIALHGEGKAIGGQPIVIVVREAMERERLVVDNQSAGLE